MKAISNKSKETKGTSRDDRSKSPKKFHLKTVPKPPFPLKVSVRKFYKNICEFLIEQEAMAGIDSHIVAMCAQALDLYAKCLRECTKAKTTEFKNKEGVVIKTVKHSGYKAVFANGTSNVSTDFVLMSAAKKDFFDISKQLGLDLKSRQTILAFLDDKDYTSSDPAMKLIRARRTGM